MMIYFGKVITMGFEPTIFWFVVRRLIRWATRPVLSGIKIRGTPEPGFMTTQKMTRQLYKWVHVSCDGRVVKALDLKSNGIFPRRFEPYSQRCGFSKFSLKRHLERKSQVRVINRRAMRFFPHNIIWMWRKNIAPITSTYVNLSFFSCDGRVVKAFD